MHLLFAATSGWGKSYHCQAYAERNTSEYDAVVLLDWKDEYGGLVEADHMNRWLVDPKTVRASSPSWWQRTIERNIEEKRGSLQLARDVTTVGKDDWKAVAGDVVAACRATEYSILVIIDEAHFVAPQSGSVPDSIETLGTTGAGELCNSAYVTQRLAMLEEDVVSQCTAKLLGGFGGGNDLDKVADYIEYPDAVHNSGGHHVSGLPEDLHATDADAPHGGACSVRKWEDDDETLTGSEWIWSDESGLMERLDTSTLQMESTHYGVDRKKIKRPEYE